MPLFLADMANKANKYTLSLRSYNREGETERKFDQFHCTKMCFILQTMMSSKDTTFWHCLSYH